MAAWTLAQAQEHLAAWMAADEACAAGQSYAIGSRSLTRSNASEITKKITFWRNEVEKLQQGVAGGVRVMRIVPRD